MGCRCHPACICVGWRCATYLNALEWNPLAVAWYAYQGLARDQAMVQVELESAQGQRVAIEHRSFVPPACVIQASERRIAGRGFRSGRAHRLAGLQRLKEFERTGQAQGAPAQAQLDAKQKAVPAQVVYQVWVHGPRSVGIEWM